MIKGRTTRIAGVAALMLAVGVTGTLSPATPASAAASLQLSRSNAAAGDRVNVNGYGFHGNDDVVVSADIRVNGNGRRIQASAHTDGSGSFGTALYIPGGTSQGTYRIVARDLHGTTASQSINVLAKAFLQVGDGSPVTYVIANHDFYVSGAGYRPGETIRLTASFPLYDGNTTTVGRNVQANAGGKFIEALVRVARDARAGDVVLLGTGQASGRKGRATLKVVYRPFIYLDSRSVKPGGAVAVNGRDFVPNSSVRISVPISRSGATTITLTKTTGTDGNGAFRTSLGLPGNVKVGNYTVTAVDAVGGFRASASLNVTPKPAPTPTATPIPATAIPATPTPTPQPAKPKQLHFQYISIWWHVVRVGTYEHVVVQAAPHRTLGIWVQVIFPNGKRYYYYENTDNQGRWERQFNIPRNAISRQSNQATITFQIWKGNKSRKSFRNFTLV